MKRALDNEQESRPSPKRALSFTCGITKGIGLFLGKPSSVNIALGTPKGGMVQTFRSMTLDQIVKHVKSNTEVHYGALCSASTREGTLGAFISRPLVLDTDSVAVPVDHDVFKGAVGQTLLRRLQAFAAKAAVHLLEEGDFVLKHLIVAHTGGRGLHVTALDASHYSRTDRVAVANVFLDGNVGNDTCKLLREWAERVMSHTSLFEAKGAAFMEEVQRAASSLVADGGTGVGVFDAVPVASAVYTEFVLGTQPSWLARY
eukprot:5308192-Prymnesium_polylepis.1